MTYPTRRELDSVYFRVGKKFDFCPDCERKLVRWLKDEVEK